MKIAIACWDNRIAPVFDTARQIKLIDVQDGQILSEKLETLQETPPPQKLGQLQALGVQTLVCGAISRPLHQMLLTAGIEVVPFLAGELCDVAQAWISGGTPMDRFVMPGCCGRGRGRGLGRGMSSGTGGGLGRGRGPCLGVGAGWGLRASEDNLAGDLPVRESGRGVGQGQGHGAGSGSGLGAGLGRGNGNGFGAGGRGGRGGRNGRDRNNI